MIKNGLFEQWTDFGTGLSKTLQFTFWNACVFAFTAITAFASINSCPTSTASTTRAFTGGSSYTLTIPGTGSGSPISNSLTGVNASNSNTGCTAIDLTFNNFAVTSTGTNDVGNVLATAGNTYMFVSPSGTSQINPDTVNFATIQGTADQADQAINDGTTNYKTQTGESFTTTQSYTVSDSGASGIQAVVLTVFGITIQTGGSGTFTLDICQKGTGSVNPTGNITSQTLCNTAVGGTGIFQTITITLATGSSQLAELFPTGHPGFIDVTQVATVTGGTAAGNETGFYTFSDEFYESPEPSTFLLLAAGLALAGLTRLRACFGADKRT